MYHYISRAYLSRQSMLRKSLLNEQTNHRYVLATLRMKPVGTVIFVIVEFMDLAQVLDKWIESNDPYFDSEGTTWLALKSQYLML